MNQFFSNNPVFVNALKLRVRTSGPISGSTGDVRLSFGDLILKSQDYFKQDHSNKFYAMNGARLIT